jgi:hypothetical protein
LVNGSKLDSAASFTAFGSATALTLGNATSATLTVNPGTIVGNASNTTQNVFNTIATTVNAFGAATSLNIGSSSAGTLTVNNPTIATSVTSSTLALFNTGLTGTLNFAGAAATINVGSNTSTATFKGKLLSVGAQGYATGAGVGSTVAQTSSRTNAVSINNLAGQITLVSNTASAGGVTTFTVNNSTVSTYDTIILSQGSGTGIYFLGVTNVTSGAFNISVYTPAAVGSAEAPVINFTVIKGTIN